MNPVDIKTYPEVCGNCGSFFFFQEKWKNLNHLKEKLGNTYKNIEEDLTSIRDITLNCFAQPIDRAPRTYDSEIENIIRSLFDF